MKIAIASGKGGTGKTTFSVNLSLLASETQETLLADLDVEEPNCHAYLSGPKLEFKKQETITLPFPVIDSQKCKECGKCAKKCNFNALAILPGMPMVFKEMCHACGRCSFVCPAGAIEEKAETIGTTRFFEMKQLQLIEGTINTGLSQVTAVIKAVKEKLKQSNLFQIRDCPPGTTCSMVESVQESDLVILVAESTPFGLHDLDLAVEALNKLGLSFAVVENKAREGESGLIDYCHQKNIQVLGQIPFSRRAAVIGSRSGILINDPEYREIFSGILDNIKRSTAL